MITQCHDLLPGQHGSVRFPLKAAPAHTHSLQSAPTLLTCYLDSLYNPPVSSLSILIVLMLLQDTAA